MTTPPLESADQAIALPEVQGIYAEARIAAFPGALSAVNLAMLTAALRDAGVELGAYDARILAWQAGWEPEQCAALKGWIERAWAAGLAAGRAEAAVPAASAMGAPDGGGEEDESA